MITEQDLRSAIAECIGTRNPDARTCIKLAAFYTIQQHLYPESVDAAESALPAPGYSYSVAPGAIDYDSGSDFAEIIQGRDPAEVWPVMDELMSTLQTMIPKLYEGVMRRLAQ